ncbi:MAG: hypothetical protein Q8Q15_03415, partial [bacterium]|nr:hypothetical protein [bacterium]
IKEKTEITRGVILASGRGGHYHFMGTERLLTEDQWPIFVGLCLCMLDPNKKQLVDTKWAAHTLTPMKYLKEVEVDKDIKWSAYDFKTMFATLRIVTGEKKPWLPVVVDVL